MTVNRPSASLRSRTGVQEATNRFRGSSTSLSDSLSVASVEEVDVPHVETVGPVSAVVSGPVDVLGLRHALQSVLEVLR